MRTSLAGLGLVGIGALLLAAAPAVAQGLLPAGTDEILAGARSCAAATAPNGVDGQKLEADGWHKAAVSANGKPMATTLVFYGKANLLLMVDSAASSPICLVTARLPSAGDFPKLQAAMTASYGAPVKNDGKGTQLFIAPEHRIIQLAFTGSQDKPAVRIAVGAVFQETK